jgi:hypothetical protein
MMKRYLRHALAAGLFLLAAITSASAENSPTIVAGEGSSGEVMVGMDVTIYTDGMDDVRHFMGNQFSAGGRDGSLGTVTVTQVQPPECGNTLFHLRRNCRMASSWPIRKRPSSWRCKRRRSCVTRW